MKLCVIISCTEKDTKEAITQTYEGIVNQKKSPFSWDIVFWCAQGCPQSLVRYVQHLCHTGKQATKLVTSLVLESNASFLGDLSSSLLKLSRASNGYSHVLLCSSGVVPKENCFLSLEEKVKNMAKTTSTVLTAFGIRMFPHEKLDDMRELREGVQWKFYDNQHAGRALHFFTPEFCIIDVNTLHQISAHQSAPFPQFDNIWCSFILGHTLGFQVWKFEAKSLIDCIAIRPSHFFQYSEINEHRESLYLHMCQNNWPCSVFNPPEKLKIIQPEWNKQQPSEVWKQGFCGVNMAITPASELDFAAAASCGIKVIRVGAIADAKDMAFVIDPKASSTEEDKAHLLKVLSRLRNALSKASESGLKVIITMADLPGRCFHSCSEESGSFSFWESPLYRSRAVKFWGYMAEALANMSSSIMGYDVINEPYTPEDRENGFFDDTSLAHADEVNQFYKDVLKEIRLHDKTVAVIIKSTWFASPRSIEILQPLPDPHVVYSFHMYTPPCLTLYRLFGPTYTYPGSVPRWPCIPNETIEVTRDYLQHLLDTTVHSWQIKHKIPSSRILVAEFGICREVVGAQQYIQDLISIFKQFGWSWLVFSFRDEEWDAMDYELGPDVNNMLDRSTDCALFKTISHHFH